MNVKILSVRQAAGILGISEKAVYQRIYRCQIPFRRMGRRVVIPEQELGEFLARLPGLNTQQALESVEQAHA